MAEKNEFKVGEGGVGDDAVSAGVSVDGEGAFGSRQFVVFDASARSVSTIDALMFFISAYSL